jgi:hypothetical protein
MNDLKYMVECRYEEILQSVFIDSLCPRLNFRSMKQKAQNCTDGTDGCPIPERRLLSHDERHLFSTGGTDEKVSRTGQTTKSILLCNYLLT